MNPSSLCRAASLAPVALSAIAAVLLSAHAGADDRTDTTALSLTFAAEVGGRPFACGRQYANVGLTDGDIAFADFRLFISEVALVDAAGRRVPVRLADDGRWQDGQVALLDFEDGTDRCDNGTPPVNSRVSGRAPAGDYTGIEFVIGVPFESNHGDPTLAGSPLNLTSMFWNWRGGYRFMKLDMMPVGETALAGTAMSSEEGAAMEHGSTTHGSGHGSGHGAAAGAWMLHLGSTGCRSASRTTAPDAPCAQPNRVMVSFDDFDADTDLIVIDPAAVLVDSDLQRNAPDTSPGCMSFPGDADCASVLPRIGLAYGDVVGDRQQLMTVRRDAL